MNNLIVTILAIAMTGALALTGMYYGGSAFTGSKSRADAAAAVEFVRTYARGIRLWSQRNGGVMPRPASAFPVSAGNSALYNKTEMDNFLSPRYLQPAARPNTLISTANWSDLALYRSEASNFIQNPFLVALLGTTAANASNSEICYLIEQMRTGVRPGSLRSWNGGPAYVNGVVCGEYGCFSNNGSWGAAVGFIVYHRLSGRPNINNPDVNPKTCS